MQRLKQSLLSLALALGTTFCLPAFANPPANTAPADSKTEASAGDNTATETAKPLPIDELRAFAEVFGRIKNSYVEPVEDKKLLTEAINGMLTGLDPHSSYLNEESFKDLQVGTHGEFGGLGIEVGMEDGIVKVISPIEDTPAFRAGIKTGDMIIKLDDTLVKGLTLNEAVNRMRGKPGSKINLTIIRKEDPQPKVVTLVRDVIKVQSVKSNLSEPGYGFIRVTQFQERTTEDVAHALEKLIKENKGDLKGLVLDLRNDPGGLLNAAVGVSAAFLEKDKLVVYTDGRTEDAKMRLSASPEHYLRGNNQTDYLQKLPASVKTVPMIVLVNSGSASASEIVAGALQDHKRAIIMGTQTFGKGSVQTILPLGNKTAIKLTTARYYTPNGRSIQAKGIEPDIVVNSPETSNPLRVREVDLQKHLENDKETEKPNESKNDTPAKPAKPAPHGNQNDDEDMVPFKFGGENDEQLKQAINLLKGLYILNKK